MRIRLFWQLLATFAFLIFFGIGGTIGLIGVRVQQITSANLPESLDAIQQVWVAALADYYTAHGSSWAGVEERLAALADTRGPFSSVDYVLFDDEGRAIVQRGSWPASFQRRGNSSSSPATIVADGQTVGFLALFSTPQWGPFASRGEDNLASPDIPELSELAQQPEPVLPPRPVMPTLPAVPREPEVPLSPAVEEQIGGSIAAETTPLAARRNRSVEEQIGRSIFLVVFGIGSMMLGLAVIMSRRISAPLAQLTRAAQKVAAGDLRVEVPRSSIREVDTLSRAFSAMATGLQRLDEARRNMTADIAHELRTPLTVIKGKLEGILDGVYPGTPAHIAPVLEEANLLERLVEDLRMLSLAEAGQLPLYREPVSAAELLEDTRHSFAAEAASHGIGLTLDLAPDLPPVDVDPQRMQQVLGNLVANSLRYTPAGGRIDLRASISAGNVTIAISDTGRGIAPEDLTHIFDRFWRGDRSRTRQGGGAGLGLAIARQLVEAHGGRIAAASRLGHGTTIMIELPIARPELPVARVSSA